MTKVPAATDQIASLHHIEAEQGVDHDPLLFNLSEALLPKAAHAIKGSPQEAKILSIRCARSRADSKLAAWALGCSDMPQPWYPARSRAAMTAGQFVSPSSNLGRSPRAPEAAGLVVKSLTWILTMRLPS